MCSAPDCASTSTLKLSFQKSTRIGAFTAHPQCKCTTIDVFRLTNGWHAIQHLGDKASAFFLKPLLLDLAAEGFLILNILRPCRLSFKVNPRNRVETTEALKYLQFVVRKFDSSIKLNPNTLGFSWRQWGFATGSRSLWDFFTGYSIFESNFFHANGPWRGGRTRYLKPKTW